MLKLLNQDLITHGEKYPLYKADLQKMKSDRIMSDSPQSLLCCLVSVESRKKRNNCGITSIAPITLRVNLSVTTANPHYSGLYCISLVQVLDAF